MKKIKRPNAGTIFMVMAVIFIAINIIYLLEKI